MEITKFNISVGPPYQSYLNSAGVSGTTMLKAASRLVRQHTRPTRGHLTPELRLHLLTPECPLWGSRDPRPPFPDPYWAFYWPGGQAVARYILDHPDVVRSRRVLDVGAGCGAGAIAAVKMAAKTAVCNDIDLYAVAAARLNAELNGVDIETSTDDFIGSECEGFETILIGDMFYDEEFAKMLFEWLRSLTNNGKDVLIGDPGRHGLTDSRRQCMSLLAKYALPEGACIENNGFRETTVWRLNK